MRQQVNKTLLRSDFAKVNRKIGWMSGNGLLAIGEWGIKVLFFF